MDYGIKVSKDGINVNSSLDKDLVYSSKYNSLKIVIEDFNGPVVLNNNQRLTHTYNSGHGLGYAPSHMCFFKDLFYGGNQYWMPVGAADLVFGAQPGYDPSASPTSGTTLAGSFTHRSWSDTTNMTSEIDNTTGSTHTYYLKQFILIEDNA